MMRHLFVSLLLVFVARTAIAQEGEAPMDPPVLPRLVRLDFQGVEGHDCPTADRFRDEVAARIGRVPFDESAPASIEVRITHDGERAIAAVTFEEEGNRMQRIIQDASCAEAAEAAATAVAVLIDEREAQPTTSVIGVLRTNDPDVENALGGLTGVAVGERMGGIGLRTDARVRLVVTSNLTDREPDSQWSFHIESNTGRGTGGAAHFFERLCLLPCDTRIRPGVHQFGLSENTFVARALPELVEIERDSRLHVEYIPASPMRRVGSWLGGWGFLGVLAFVPTWLVGALADKERTERIGLAGTVVSSAFLVSGILMIRFSQGEETEVSVTPL